MIIIVEGPNNVGKTTIINALLKKLPDYTVEHTSNLCPNTFEYYMECLSKDNIIFDRLHIGEMVYPQIYNRKAKISEDEFNNLLKIDNVIYLFVDADDEFIARGYENKSETYDWQFSLHERKLFNDLADKLIDAGCDVVKVHNHIDNEYFDNRTENAIAYLLTRCNNE